MKKIFTPLSNLQKEILVGILLGDAHLEKQRGAINYRLKIHQNEKHKEYVNHLYNVFNNIVNTPPKLKTVFAFNKNFESWYFNTTIHPEFMEFGEKFYRDSKKVLPNNINDILTPCGLAYWYMDDGSLKSKESKGVLLNTQNFTLEEVEILCSILNDKWQLSSWPRKQKEGHQIYISGKSYENLAELIESFLLPTMKYKFPTPRK